MSARSLTVSRINFYTDRRQTELLRGNQSCTGACERVEHQFTGLQSSKSQAPLGQGHRKRGWMEITVSTTLCRLVRDVPSVSSAMQLSMMTEACGLVGPYVRHSNRQPVDR
jgi:hypothetical protein